jgi:hypothetical protein
MLLSKIRKEMNNLTRRETLETAIKCVCGNREEDYGSPENNFQCCADLWNIYLGSDIVSAHDVSVMMALLKIARIASGKTKNDSYIDAAGYLACAAEIITSKETTHDNLSRKDPDPTTIHCG